MEKEEEELYAAGNEIYISLLKELEDASPGFVCWGDAEMAGSAGGTLPFSFKKKIDKTYFSGLESGLKHTARIYDARIPGIDVVNMGAVNEELYEIMVRTGAHQMMLGEDFDMPAYNDRKNIMLVDNEGHTLLFAGQEHAYFGSITIDGIDGRFYAGDGSYDDVHPVIAFARNENGDGYVIPAGTEIEIGTAGMFRMYYPILFFSEMEDIEVSEFIECMREIISIYGKQESEDDRDGDEDSLSNYVIICVTEKGSEWDITLREAFGGNYLRNDKFVDEMTSEDYDALANLTLQIFESQGAFDKVKKAVDEANEKLQQLDSKH